MLLVGRQKGYAPVTTSASKPLGLVVNEVGGYSLKYHDGNPTCELQEMDTKSFWPVPDARLKIKGHIYQENGLKTVSAFELTYHNL